jgi:hypothetical protein
MNTCSISGCEKPAKARGWCNMHWQRWRKYGDPNATVHEREFCRKLREKYHLKSIRELPEHRVWTNMLDRCENPRREQYKYYGARGINVCVSWHFFRTFYEDMGSRPSEEHQLDRINNDGATLGKEYGVSKHMIYLIVNNKKWVEEQ